MVPFDLSIEFFTKKPRPSINGSLPDIAIYINPVKQNYWLYWVY
jgi:hypothetical protein